MKYLRIMKKLILLSLAIILSATLADAQQILRCGTEQYMAEMKAKDPSLQQQMDKVEQATQQWIANHPHYQQKYRITIPVVVHVVWYVGDPNQNISDAQIQSQIDVLNEDYNRTNADAINTPSYFLSLIHI